MFYFPIAFSAFSSLRGENWWKSAKSAESAKGKECMLFVVSFVGSVVEFLEDITIFVYYCFCLSIEL